MMSVRAAARAAAGAVRAGRFAAVRAIAMPTPTTVRAVPAVSARPACAAVRPYSTPAQAAPVVESAEQETSGPVEIEGNNLFEKLGLRAELVRTLSAGGITEPFPIQARALPTLLEGNDILGRAETGSGKTLAFVLPMLHRLSLGRAGSNPRALIMSPTRELAMQIFRECEKYGASLGLRAGVIYGGVGYDSQVRRLREGVDIVVGTPGRLSDLATQGQLNVRELQIVVFDEADELLKHDFKAALDEILGKAPSVDKRQTVFFSATLTAQVNSLVREYARPNPELIDLIGEGQKTPSKVVHQAISVHASDRYAIVRAVLAKEDPEKAMVFTPTKIEATKLALDLSGHGIKCAPLHGELTQDQRDMFMEQFRNGDINVIVATDVAARGIDVPEVELVLQTKPPDAGMIQSYIHRSGRTGRAGRAGKAIILHSPIDAENLQMVERTVQLQHVKPPTLAEIVEANLDRTLKRVEAVSEGIVDMCEAKAKALIDEQGARGVARVLAAAAHLEKAEAREFVQPRAGFGGSAGNRVGGFGGRGGGGFGARRPRDSFGGGRDGGRDSFRDSFGGRDSYAGGRPSFRDSFGGGRDFRKGDSDSFGSRRGQRGDGFSQRGGDGFGGFGDKGRF